MKKFSENYVRYRMTVHELIKELGKIPNQNLQVEVSVEDNEFLTYPIDEVKSEPGVVKLIMPLIV